MALSPPNVTIAAQDTLDNEIAALTLMLSNLRTRRNALSPISRLPPEILSSIFIRCAHHPQKNRWGVPDWVNVSYVCRQWRRVALNCSTLWSFLFVSSKHWTDELLARSKTAPLNVHLDSEYSTHSRDLNLLEKVASQADRIQVLHLWLSRPGAEHSLSLLSSPAPLLQTLHISVERSDYLGETALVSGAPFDSHTPALRELELINFAFPLTSPTLCGLTSLRLRDLGASFQPTLVALMVALSRMRHLTHLHLENALPSASANPSDPACQNSEKHSFPKLSRLSIVAPFTTVVLLLSCFDIPLKTEVRLRCCFEADVEDHSPIYPLLAKRFVAPQDQAIALTPVIRTSFIEIAMSTIGFIFSTAKRDSGRQAFSASRSYDLGQLREDWDCNIPLKVDVVQGTSSLSDREDLVRGVCRSLPLTSLQSAHFSFNSGSVTALSSDFWKKTFGHLEELQHVKLSGVSMVGLIRALSPIPLHLPKNKSGGLPSDSVQTFAPALEDMELLGVSFSNGCYGRSKGLPDMCSCSAPCLDHVLCNRQAGGHGLRRLVLTKCSNLQARDVEGFRQWVTVDWDGFIRPMLCLDSGGNSDDD